MENKYLIFNFTFTDGDVEILTAFLLDAGWDGVEEVSLHEVNAYLLESKYSEELLEQLKGKLYFDINCSFQKLPDKNWNQEWESNFSPVIIDDFCIVKADFHTDLPPVEHIITINPKLAFGTGHHMTTYMMIKAMRHIDFQNKHVIDLGTGTAILAILAEKLGARSILATDSDDKAIENSIENIVANQSSKITLKDHLYPIAQHSGDIVLANINMNALTKYQPVIEDIVRQDGLVLLSGILYEQAVNMISLYTASNKLKLLSHSQGGEWNILILKRLEL